MRIFITVGTTPFDKLIRFCDENLDPALEITIQYLQGCLLRS